MPNPFQSPSGYRVTTPTVISEYDHRLLCLAYSLILGSSALEDHKLELFVHMLGGQDSVGAAAYLSLKTRGPKQAALNAAAEVVLNQQQKTMLNEIEREVHQINQVRDELAHSVIVTPKSTPKDTLVFRNPEKGRKEDGYLRSINLTEMKRWQSRIANASTALHAFSKLIGHPHEIPDLPNDEATLVKLIKSALSSQGKAFEFK